MCFLVSNHEHNKVDVPNAVIYLDMIFIFECFVYNLDVIMRMDGIDTCVQKRVD